jgi:hypothetical protein
MLIFNYWKLLKTLQNRHCEHSKAIHDPACPDCFKLRPADNKGLNRLSRIASFRFSILDLYRQDGIHARHTKKGTTKSNAVFLNLPSAPLLHSIPD